MVKAIPKKFLSIFTHTLALAFCLALLLTAPAVAASDTPMVRTGEKYGVETGTFVEVPVYVENAPGVAGYQFDLRFDPEIAMVKAREGESTAVKLGDFLSGSAPIVNYNRAAEGLIRVAWMDLQEFSGSGEICRITFEVLEKGTTALKLERVELVRLAGRFSVDSADGFITSDKQADVRVSGVNIPEGDQTIVEGKTVQLTAAVTPINAFNKEVTWQSGKTDVATVSSNGLVAAVGEGSAEISVTTRDGNFKDTVTVTVRPSGIIVDTSRQLPHAYLGSEYEYTLSARGENDSFTWSIKSGDLPPGLSLDDDGEISGTPEGTGRYDFTLKVTDEDENEVEQDFVLWVADRGSSTTEGSFTYAIDHGAFKNLNISYDSMEVNLQTHEMPFTMVVVDRSATHVNITVDLFFSDDKLTINGSSQSPSIARRVPLSRGTNTISVAVQPSSGDAKYYNITIFKL